MQRVASWLPVFRTGTGGTGSGAYPRTFSSGPLCHWCDRRRAAFLTCPKGYVSQRAADRKAVYQNGASNRRPSESQRRSQRPAKTETRPADGGIRMIRKLALLILLGASATRAQEVMAPVVLTDIEANPHVTGSAPTGQGSMWMDSGGSSPLEKDFAGRFFIEQGVVVRSFAGFDV